MARTKSNKDRIRKIQQTQDTYSISIPARIMQKLGWKKKQKVVVTESRNRLTIKDWKKKRR